MNSRLDRTHAGFTLLEVLVAVAIIAVIALVVGIGLSGLGGNRQLKQEAERLQSRLRYACELATLDGRAVGFRQRSDGYGFVRLDGDEWRSLTQDALLAPYQLSASTTLLLHRDGQVLEVDAKATDETPQLVCFASGELTPFRAELRATGADQRYRIEGHADGRIALSHVDVAF